MRTKDEILKEAGNLNGWNPHAGIPMDTKEITFLEILIDIRDHMTASNTMLYTFLAPEDKERFNEAEIIKG